MMEKSTYYRRLMLSGKMLICNKTVKNLLSKIEEIENDVQSPTTEKIEKMQKIRDEIMKVDTEIDNIKNEIKLLDSRNIN